MIENNTNISIINNVTVITAYKDGGGEGIKKTFTF